MILWLSNSEDAVEEVYCYSYDAYKILAGCMNYDKFPIKIGKTTVGSAERIQSQCSSGTSLPEYPHIYMVVHTPNATKLEKLIQDFLALQNHAVANAPGKEWYMTNPEELEKIVQTIDSMMVA